MVNIENILNNKKIKKSKKSKIKKKTHDIFLVSYFEKSKSKILKTEIT